MKKLLCIFSLFLLYSFNPPSDGRVFTYTSFVNEHGDVFDVNPPGQIIFTETSIFVTRPHSVIEMNFVNSRINSGADMTCMDYPLSYYRDMTVRNNPRIDKNSPELVPLVYTNSLFSHCVYQGQNIFVLKVGDVKMIYR